MITLKTLVVLKTDCTELYQEYPKSYIKNDRITDQYKDNRIRIDSSGKFIYNLLVVDDIFISKGLTPCLYYRAFVVGTNKLCDHYERVNTPENYSFTQCILDIQKCNINVIGL